MRSSSPPVTSSHQHTIANCNLVNISAECTQTHPAEFPLIVSARLCSREGAISKPILLVCQKRRTDRKFCCICWLCSCLLRERPTKINIPMWFHIYLSAKCTLNYGFCILLCRMEKRVTLFMWQPILKLVASRGSDAKNYIWKERLRLLYQLMQIWNFNYTALVLSVNFDMQILLSTLHPPTSNNYSSPDVSFESVQKVFSFFINLPGFTAISEDCESHVVD